MSHNVRSHKNGLSPSKHTSTHSKYTMRLVSLAISVIALCSTVANAWNEDERCKNVETRNLQGNRDDEEHVPKDLSDKAVVSVNENLRGSDSHRRLQMSPFRLKMHHEEGYCWQKEWEDRKWCASCKGGTCQQGDLLWVQKCSSANIQLFLWESLGGTTGILKPYTRQDLCWTRTHQDYYYLNEKRSYFSLLPCQPGDENQVLDGLRTDTAFELYSPVDGDSFCVTQAHHPKAGEEMFTEKCSKARFDLTSLWEVDAVNANPPVQPQAPTATCERGGLLYQEGVPGPNQEEVASGTPIVNFDYNVFIEQETNGNLRVFQGWPEQVGNLIWESGVNESPGDYYTRLQGDGNMITYRGKTGDTSTSVWKTAKSGADTHYFFGVECDLESVAIYEFYPDDPGTRLWYYGNFDPENFSTPVTAPPITTPVTPSPTLPLTPSPITPESTSAPVVGAGVSPTASPTSLPAVEDKGMEYCDDNVCGMCQGDCDEDFQCEGDLRCFHRDAPYVPVPGCSGAESMMAGKYMRRLKK